MGKIKDLTGRSFGRLKVICYTGLSKRRSAVWECLCSCGTRKLLCSNDFLRGTKSCGCLKKGFKFKHGENLKVKEYLSWYKMRERCVNPKSNRYHIYGSLGIKVCDRWLTSYSNFLEDMGRAPSRSHSLDRIDVNGDYEKSNCRWATPLEQANNKRSTKMIHYKGSNKTLSMWCRELGLKYATIRYRIYFLKWPINVAFELKKEGNP